MKIISHIFVCSLFFIFNLCYGQSGNHLNGRKPLIISSIPKSGTHLISKLITQITGMEGPNAPTLTALIQAELNILPPNSFYVTHAPYTNNNARIASINHAKIILLLRDPRDVLVFVCSLA